MSDAIEALSRARADLARARTVDEFLAVMTKAELARTLAARLRLGLESTNEATAIHLHAAAGLATAVDEGQANGALHGGGRPTQTNTNRIGLSDLGLNSARIREARLIRLAAGSTDIDELRRDRDSEGKQLTKSEVVAIGRRIESGIEPGQQDDWYTPGWLFDALDVVFDMDVCAPTVEAHRTCPAKQYLTEDDDGLTTEWDGLVWCNPPYSHAAPWVARWLEHGNGVLLAHIPANAAWSVDLSRHAETVVWLQAVEFHRPNGQTYRPGYALQLAGIGDGAGAVRRCGQVTAKAGSVWERVA